MNGNQPDTTNDGRIRVIFLPGITTPAALRYTPLLHELGNAVNAVTKELEVYATNTPPADFSIEDEVEGIARAADAAGFDRFHLYGYSGGGASALAYVATYPERVLSLAMDEPGTDFSPEHRAAMRDMLQRLSHLPPADRRRGALRQVLAPGVTMPPPPPGPPPAWMAKRPAGTEAFANAIIHYQLDPDRLLAFEQPVYFSYGSLSNPEEFEAMRDRLAALFPDFTAERYEGASHLNTSHQLEPARVAAALLQLWQRAESRSGEIDARPARA
jgi:pimeloyl-ACP methyl ester carboxylesterase